MKAPILHTLSAKMVVIRSGPMVNNDKGNKRKEAKSIRMILFPNFCFKWSYNG